MHQTVSIALDGPVTVNYPSLNGQAREQPTGDESGRPSKRVALIAASAMLFLAAAGGIIWNDFGRSEAPPPEVPAPAIAFNASPESESVAAHSCSVVPRTTEQHSLRGTPSTEAVLASTFMVMSPVQEDVLVPAMAVDDLPGGDQVGPETIVAVEAVVGELVACLNTGDFVRVDALYNDDSFLRVYGHLGDEAVATPESTPPSEQLDVPDILGAYLLPDGRVGVLLSHDVGGFGLQEYLVLVEESDRWLIDEQVVVAPEPALEGTPVANQIEITVSDFAFQPNHVIIPANSSTPILLVNTGEARVGFAIDALGIDVYLDPGETTTVEINAAPGEYTFLSEIPGERAAGLIGTLVAVEDATPVASTAN